MLRKRCFNLLRKPNSAPLFGAFLTIVRGLTVIQVELLEAAGDLDSAEEVLLSYAGRHRLPRGSESEFAVGVWPNALHLLYAFYERHPPPGDDQCKHIGILEELCTLVHCSML